VQSAKGVWVFEGSCQTQERESSDRDPDTLHSMGGNLSSKEENSVRRKNFGADGGKEEKREDPYEEEGSGFLQMEAVGLVGKTGQPE